MMLTLEACKALKALGYPQDGGQWLDEHGLYYKNVSGVMAACPDSIDALDWLETLGWSIDRWHMLDQPVYYKPDGKPGGYDYDPNAPSVVIYGAVHATLKTSVGSPLRVSGRTPSALIVAVARALKEAQ